jgi:hypothetical protein
MIRLYTKKAFGFKNPDTGELERTAPLAFGDYPDWVANDEMFKLAKEAGEIEVMESAKAQKEVETGKGKGKEGKQNEGQNQGQTGGEGQPKE